MDHRRCCAKSLNKSKALGTALSAILQQNSGDQLWTPLHTMQVGGWKHETLSPWLQKFGGHKGKHMQKISSLLDNPCLLSLDDMVKLILDPSHLIDEHLLLTMEDFTRNLCFALHQKRSMVLGYSSWYRHSKGTLLLHHNTNLNTVKSGAAT